MMPRMSDSFMIRSSSPSKVTSVPDHLPNRMRSPALTTGAMSAPAPSRARPQPPPGAGQGRGPVVDHGGDELARVRARALAHGDDLALGGLLLGIVRNDEAALGLLFALDPAHQHPLVKQIGR